MIQINVGDHSGNENGVPFTPIPNQHLGQVRWARRKAIWITRNIATANSYFLPLPRGRSLSNLLADSSIWINFNPTLGDFGATFHNKTRRHLRHLAAVAVRGRLNTEAGTLGECRPAATRFGCMQPNWLSAIRLAAPWSR